MQRISFRIVLTIILGYFITGSLNSQEITPSGKPIGKIYADFRQQINGESSYHGFAVTRAFIGYAYRVDKNLSAQVLLDIGDPLSNEEISSKRYTYIRNAFISYNLNNLTLTFGVTDGIGHREPLVFWGKRYLSPPFLLNYRYVNIADIGLIADYSISPMLSFDFMIMNGEGFTNIQADNSFLYGAGVTFKPVDGFILRLFGDTYKNDEAVKNTVASFAGYKNSRFSLGVEYNYKTDFDWTDQHNVFGYSAMGSYYLSDKFELFARYDRSASVTPEGETDPWNLLKDGSLIVTGVQFKQSKNLKLSINYQGWTPKSDETLRWDFIQCNLEFQF